MRRGGIVVAMLLVWSALAKGEPSGAQSVPSADEVARALRTMKAVSQYLKGKRDETAACEQKIRATAAFQPIAKRIPPPGSKPTDAQLAETSLITDEEAHAMAALAPQYRACRAIAEDAEAALSPAMGKISKDAEEEHARIVAELLARKLSWGAYYKAMGELAQQFKARRAEARLRMTETPN